jgi:hypothetical protein
MLASGWSPNPDEVKLKIEDSKLSIGGAAALPPIQYISAMRVS